MYIPPTANAIWVFLRSPPAPVGPRGLPLAPMAHRWPLGAGSVPWPPVVAPRGLPTPWPLRPVVFRWTPWSVDPRGLPLVRCLVKGSPAPKSVVRSPVPVASRGAPLPLVQWSSVVVLCCVVHLHMKPNEIHCNQIGSVIVLLFLIVAYESILNNVPLHC